MKTKYLLALATLAVAMTLQAQHRTVFTLDECKQLALEYNNDLKNARLDQKAARAKKNEIATNYFPHVNMMGFAFHSFDYLVKMDMTDIFGRNEFGYNMQVWWSEVSPEMGANPTFNFLKYGQRYGISAIQPVFMGGQIVNGNRYAALGIEAASLKGSIAERNVLEEVEKNYFDVIALQEKQKTLDALSEMLDSLEAVADIALREGVILKADHMLLQTKRQELQNGQVRLRTGMRLLKMNLLNCVGIGYSILDIDSYTFVGEDMDNVPTPESVYVDELTAAGSVEESRLLDLQVEAAKYEKKLTLGSTLPQIGVGVSYGYTRLIENGDGRTNGTVFAAVRVPVSDWAKNSYKMQQQQVAIDKAMNDRTHLREMLVLQQRKFYLELTSAWDALELARSQRAYTSYLYDQAKLSYEAGYTTVTDLLQAYSSVASVEETYSNAVAAYLKALQTYTSHIK